MDTTLKCEISNIRTNLLKQYNAVYEEINKPEYETPTLHNAQILSGFMSYFISQHKGLLKQRQIICDELDDIGCSTSERFLLERSCGLEILDNLLVENELMINKLYNK